MEVKTDLDSTDLIRKIYELTHEVSIENNLDLQLQLEELYKIAELKGVM